MMLTSPPEPLAGWQKRLVMAIALVVALTRFYALSLSWWDWDEMLFQSAMVEYDVTQHHPHPPGFPLYIALGKAVRPLADTDFHALQAINFVFASLLFPAMFFLARELRLRFVPSVISGALAAFMPAVWLFGGTAFSDVPSVALLTIALALLLRGCRSRSSYVWGAVVLAVAISFRPQNLLIGLVPGVIATWYRSRDRYREIAIAALLGMAIVAASFGGAVMASRSWTDYARTVRTHQQYIAKVDSWRSPSRPPLRHLFDDFFFRQYRAGAANTVLTLFVLVALVRAAVRRDWRIALIVAAFGPFCLLAWLMLDYLSLSRFAIGYAPLFAILAAEGMYDAAGWGALVRKRDAIGGSLGAVVALSMAAYAYPAIREVRSTLSPPAAAMKWIRTNLDPRRARIYAATGMIPYTDYALQGFNVSEVADERAVPVAEADTKTPRYLILEGAGGRDFIRPRARLWNLVRHRYFEVTIFSLGNAARFGDGWYGAENVGSAVWRWMGRRSVTELPALNGQADLRLAFGFPLDSLHAIPTVTVTLNGRRIDTFRGDAMSVEREYSVPARSDGVNTLVIETNMVVNPQKAGLADDPRDLGLQLQRISWGRK